MDSYFLQSSDSIDNGRIQGITISNNGKLLAFTSNQYLNIWDLEKRCGLHRIFIHKLTEVLAFDNSSKHVMCYTYHNNTTLLRIIKVKNGKELFKYRIYLSYSRSRRIQFLTESLVLIMREGFRSCMWNLKGKKIIRQLLFNYGASSELLVSNNKKILSYLHLVEQNHFLIMIYDFQTFNLLTELKSNTKQIRNIDISSNGQFLLCCGNVNNTSSFLQIWSLRKSDRVLIYPYRQLDYQMPIYSAYFNEDASKVIVYYDNIIKIWDAISQNIIKSQSLPINYAEQQFVFSLDLKNIVIWTFNRIFIFTEYKIQKQQNGLIGII